jgi:molybdopterin molybdotransferase
MVEMISVEEARACVLENCVTLPSEAVDLREAAGRVAREPVVAREDIPPFDNSAMDGYAVLSSDFSDLPADLTVVADIPAGSTVDTELRPGSCARIMTGAVVPRGADAIAPVEWSDGFKEVGVRVTINQAPGSGQHIRKAGEDVKRGTTILEAGRRFLPSMIGSLASLGYGSVLVGKRPSISIVATGSELVDPEETPGPGQIRNSNGPALRALSESAGAQVLHEMVAPDDYVRTKATLETVSEVDILMVSGGVSVGARDFVKEALDELGTELIFWRVRQRHGKPLAFGLLGDTLVFGLPGNPVSSTVCFYQYVYPAIAKMLGMSAERRMTTARLDGPLKKALGLYHFIPGRSRVNSDGRLSVDLAGPQGSHVYSSVAAADCLIHLGEDLDEPPPPGTLVSIEPLPC